jgi:hypothetical protein
MASGGMAATSASGQGQSKMGDQKKDLMLKQQRLKLRKQNNTIKILRAKLEAAQRSEAPSNASRMSLRSPRLPHQNANDDIFLMTEQNCRLQEQVQEL